MNLLRFMFYFITAVIKLSRPGGAKAMAAENMLLRQQLITISRMQKRSPRLTMSVRLIYGILVTFINPRRLSSLANIIKPSTLLRFHKALVDRKYHWLFTHKSKNQPGPKGPSAELIKIIVEMKRHNPRFGYLRIALQIKHAFGIDVDKNIVKRVLDKHYKPEGKGNGPSWLTFLGNAKDSLWSIDLFRCESVLLKSHWVMLVMDQFSRRIIGMQYMLVIWMEFRFVVCLIVLLQITMCQHI
jgi:putative transposase